MKKVLITALVFVFGAGVLAAQPMPNKEEMKKEFKEMNSLVESYKKEKSKKKKAAIEEKVKAKVSENYDRHIKFLEKLVADSEKRLNDAKQALAKAQEPEAKVKHVDEVSKKILSGEKPTLFGPPDRNRKFGGRDRMGRDRGPRMPKDCPCMTPPPPPDEGMLPPPPPPPGPDEEFEAAVLQGELGSGK